MDGMITELKDVMGGLADPVICFSGGLDSTVLLRNAKEYCRSFTALFIRLPMNTERQVDTAKRVAEQLGVPLRIDALTWDDIKGIENNGPDRCYICKRAIYTKAFSIADSMGSKIVLAGDNADDDVTKRPGHRAGVELNVMNPLREAGIGRRRIIQAIDEMDFPFPMIKDTCMATRYPEGHIIGEKEMRFAEDCEKAVREVSRLKQLRIRYDGNIATVSTDPSEMGEMYRLRTQISYELKARGMECHLDIEGYKGS